MTADTITLALEGDVFLDDFAAAVRGFDQLIGALTSEVAKGTKVDWSVDALERSSSITTIRGVAENHDVVERVVEAYLAVGRAEEQGRDLPYGRPVRDAVTTITRILNGRVRSIRFETPDGEALIQSAEARILGSPLTAAYGSVTGRIQTLSNRGGLRFSLYDLIHDKAVSCYLNSDQEELMRGMWGRLAIVEGWVTRDRTSGRPVVVRRVSRVLPKHEVEPGSYRLAIRAVPKPDEAELPETIIRRLRDA